ncbi:hypothetical protein HNO88_001430 [Novosphingobium chloroacetimidivorans]|uniref:Uncharacterized protein n=1 Tax=Novosphingobium chloroacetimidivorans TaxID=1428314 RepID=A0A7W7K8F1_9SPHN|nr:hypothetical protein [Novosphingobium chloroacetimidivorans]
MRLKSGATFKLAGRYDDAPVKPDGMRRFSLRAYTLMIDEVLPGLFDA